MQHIGAWNVAILVSSLFEATALLAIELAIETTG